MGTRTIFLFIAIVLVASGAWFVTHQTKPASSESKVATTRYNSADISFDYPQDYSIRQFGGQDTVVELAANTPNRVLTVSKKANVASDAAAANSQVLDFLESTADQAFPKTYPDYHFSKKERRNTAGRSVSIISFSYTSLDQKQSVYSNYAIVPSGNNAYYLSLQGADAAIVASDMDVVLMNLAL